MDPRSHGDHSSFSEYLHQSLSIASERSTIPPTSKRRRSPNAFILFRSHLIATGKVPPDIVHQNDVSRYAAEVWKLKLTPSERAVFFKKAQEEKVRFDIEGPKTPAKKRRSRAKKTCQPSPSMSTAHPRRPPSPTSPLDTPFDSTDTFSSPSNISHLSPQSCSSLIIYPIPPVGDASLPFSAPQATHTIPPSLFNWDFPVDNTSMCVDEQWSPMSFNIESTAAASSAAYYFDSNMPLTDLDFNALHLDFSFTISDLDLSFLESAPSYLLPSSFVNHF
ncbi:uncharacterized protein FOMMEDRAFT_144696 [Fomitiporia mediterranea MF3/22]|uniref:uncharacterized protein n=1 Tax=Fomitiporia mediterranea (strain MF3/22) TaxID=694068 RepID=UPI00044083C4|nr:uncharacterized protein FOMMEDRAFT_144696 [Fomitiporia mediterranea MF3/22]EJD06805.1 hypothetical protein FOMMEDRAFT_144696 [Fomitiporia mediterranea MF3/22]